jgi:dihydrodipicolinate synthase/N-acetylneuraminate lyase
MSASNRRYPKVILATAVLPWTCSGAFDKHLFREQVRHICSNLTRHIYIFGTAGEGYAVTSREYAKIAEVFYNEMRSNAAFPMAGVISLSMGEMIERIQTCSEIGFETVQISFPSWGILNDKELSVFFEEVLNGFPEMKFVFYNVVRTGRKLTVGELSSLEKQYPNFVGVKTALGDFEKVESALNTVSELQLFLPESEFAYAKRFGGSALLISLAATDYQQARRFFDSDWEEANSWIDYYSQVLLCLKNSSNGNVHMDGAFDKVIQRVTMSNYPLSLKSPYLGFTEEEFKTFLVELGKLKMAFKSFR